MLKSPIAIKLNSPDIKKIISEITPEVRFGTMIAQPEMNLGFHFFQHRTRSKMKITKSLTTTDPFYYIVNPFEVDETLITKTKEVLKLKDEEKLTSDFYKLWEMMMVFDLGKDDKLTYSALGDNNFMLSLLKYRELFFSTKDDKYFMVSINPDDNKGKETTKNYLGKMYKGLVKVHKAKEDFNITNLSNISNFKKEIVKNKKLSDLVTGDGKLNWLDENYQEQEAYGLIIGQILAGLNSLDKDGTLIIKFFDTFTNLSVKLIFLLSSLFETSYLYKPYFSRVSESEKYFVGLKFKNPSELKTVIKMLEEILKDFNQEKYILNIFPKMKLPQEFVNQIRVINLQIVNEQQIMINNMITYINENNYFGEKYHQYLDQHQKAIKYWIDNFLVEKSKQKDIIKKWQEILTSINKKQEEETESLNKTLT
jgi:hypothetical protein